MLYTSSGTCVLFGTDINVTEGLTQEIAPAIVVKISSQFFFFLRFLARRTLQGASDRHVISEGEITRSHLTYSGFMPFECHWLASTPA